MIVENDEATTLLANEISSKLLSSMTDEIINSISHNDPAEIIVLADRIAAALIWKLCNHIEGYSEGNGIEGFNKRECLKHILKMIMNLLRTEKKKWN